MHRAPFPRRVFTGMRLSPSREYIASCGSLSGEGSRADGHFGLGFPPGVGGTGTQHHSPLLPPGTACLAAPTALGSSMAVSQLPWCCCTVPCCAVPCHTRTWRGPPWQCPPEKAQSHTAVPGRLAPWHRLTPRERWWSPGEVCRLQVWEFFVTFLDVCACLWTTPHAGALAVCCLVGGGNNNIGQCSKVTK